MVRQWWWRSRWRRRTGRATDTACRFGGLIQAEIFGGGELLGHELAQGEQGLLQSLEEKGQPQEDEDKTDEHLLQVGHVAAQYQDLEAKQDGGNGQHVPNGGDQDVEEVHQAGHKSRVPYIMTKIMGVSEAKAMRPKPSVRGLRPWMLVARPTPSAVTRGTVMVEVVTPPES